jgi:aminopeptidase N
LYVDRFKFRTADTSDFRRVMEEVSGTSLERFFDQWCLRPGIPRLSVDHSFDAASHTLTVTVSQIQKIDGHNPAYVLDVPVRVVLEGGGERWLHVRSDRTESTATLTLAVPPLDIEVDPNATLLASITVHKPTAMWWHQWKAGSTTFARGEAAEQVGAVSVSSVALGASRALGEAVRAGVILKLRTDASPQARKEDR